VQERGEVALAALLLDVAELRRPAAVYADTIM
jgi:hypothetical protein